MSLQPITAPHGKPSDLQLEDVRKVQDTETVNIPMKHAAAQNLGNHFVQVGFKDVPANTTLTPLCR